MLNTAFAHKRRKEDKQDENLKKEMCGFTYLRIQPFQDI